MTAVRNSRLSFSTIELASEANAAPDGDEEHSQARRFRMIAGKYRLYEVIGRGGMGIVMRAQHINLDEPVAIKLLRPTMMMKGSSMVTRFLREARASAKIKSDHVVRVTDVDTLESGLPFMVMEYLEGTTLLGVLREHGGPLPIDEAVDYVIQACDAIAEAHTLGIVHRDLKPDNLFLARRRDGRKIIKVLDFGISKVDVSGEEDMTSPGQILGSPRFMSPEQMLAQHDLDGRADIWSLGAILYNLLTGRPPFTADTMHQVCALTLHSNPVPLRTHRPEIPAELEAVVLRCLCKDPAGRFATAKELAEALAPFSEASSMDLTEALALVSEEEEAPPANALAPLYADALLASSAETSIAPAVMTRPPQRRSRALLAGGIVVALVFGAAGVMTFKGSFLVAGTQATAQPVPLNALEPTTAEDVTVVTPPSTVASIAAPEPPAAITAVASASPAASAEAKAAPAKARTPPPPPGRKAQPPVVAASVAPSVNPPVDPFSRW